MNTLGFKRLGRARQTKLREAEKSFALQISSEAVEPAAKS